MKYISLALAGVALSAAAPLMAQDAPASGQATAGATAAKPNVTAGASVADASGGAVGTIESVSGDNAIVSTGTAKATLPLSAFAQGPNGLMIGMSKADLEAAVAKATGGAQTAANGATAPVSITVGADVSDTKGGKVGTVTAVAGNMVTVATAASKAQLPKTAFAQGANGLMIAMTAAELDAAAKAAAPAKKTGS